MEVGIFFVWYIAFFIFGIIGLPFVYFFFNKWVDKGYVFAKFVGFLLVTIPIWILSSFKILHFSELNVTLFTIILLILSLILILKFKIKISKLMILEEIIFFVITFAWNLIRATNPRIEGTEKMMNMAFINSIFKTEYFPPKDMWMTPESVNYYYIGHYMYAFVSKLTSIPTNFVYNLALNTIIAQTFLGIFSIIFNFIYTKFINFYSSFIKIIFSLCGGFFVVFAGNLDYFFKVIISFIKGTKLEFFFPDSTRLIPYTINEYPSYSILLGDLHGHFLSLPFFVMAIGLLLYIFSNVKSYPELFVRNLIISPFVLIIFGINSWDVITLTILTFIVNFWILVKVNNFVIIHLLTKRTKEVYFRFLNIFCEFINVSLGFALPGILVLMPFLLFFRAPVGGFGFKFGGSPIQLLFLIWGGFFLIILLYLILALSKKISNKLRNTGFIFIMIFVGCSILVGVEFIFLKDIFFENNPNYYRANTVFKFYYHAWILLGISSSILGFAILSSFSKKRKSFLAFLSSFLIISIFVGTGLYFFRGLGDNFQLFREPNPYSYFTLDGTEFIRRDHKGDYYAIQFLNKEVKTYSVVLEAVGDAYTYYARVSTFTGLPTVMGWPTHQWQWRNDSKTPFIRKDEVKSFYESNSLDLSINFLKKYNVEYIYIGNKEIETYNINYELIEQLSELIYSNFNTKIYKVYK